MRVLLKIWNDNKELIVSGEMEGRNKPLREFLKAIIKANLKEELKK